MAKSVSLIDVNKLKRKKIRAYKVDPDMFVVPLPFLIDAEIVDSESLRPHGFWSSKQASYIDEYGDFHAGYQCSCCNAITHKSRYCGNCGAKMDDLLPFDYSDEEKAFFMDNIKPRI